MIGLCLNDVLPWERYMLMCRDFPRMLRPDYPENISHKYVLEANHSQSQQWAWFLYPSIEVSVRWNTYTRTVEIILNVECLLERYLTRYSYATQAARGRCACLWKKRGWVTIGYKPKNRMSHDETVVDRGEEKRPRERERGKRMSQIRAKHHAHSALKRRMMLFEGRRLCLRTYE